MNTSKIIFFIIICSIISLSFTTKKETKLVKLWETNAEFWGPESAVYDKANKCIYISNFNDKGGFSKSDRSLHNECISKLDLEGNIIEFNWIDSLQGCTGITIYKEHVYVVERNALTKISIKNRAVVQRFSFTNHGFPNDVTFDNEGTFYISDGPKKTIHRFKNGQMEAWMVDDELNKINGILYDNGKLIVGTNEDNCLKSVDIKSKKINAIVNLGDGGIDGIKKYGEQYLVSLYAGNIYLIDKNGQKTELLNTRDKEIKCADFEYIRSKKLLIVPALQNNNIRAYSIK